jgi:hypothetical protein
MLARSMPHSVLSKASKAWARSDAARALQHWDPEDPDSQGLRAAAVGALTVLCLIQRPEPPHLYVLEIKWAG